MSEKEPQIKKPDIRRYFCQFCGISRSKMSLLNSHLISHHKDEMDKKCSNGEEEKKSNACEDCGATFSKPSHLKQHMLSHSLERPFKCPIEDCHSSYRRKDHLNRHLLQHQGKLFTCPVVNCGKKFSFQGNMKRHVHEFHDEEPASSEGSQKQHVCPEDGCGKVFKYASKLQTHEASHVKLNTTEVFCCDPECMKPFTNKEYLKAHVESCHRYINCEICGKKQLRKNIKRHLRTHKIGVPSERIKCNFKGCLHTFSNMSNLQQHVKAVHLSLKPFTCRVSGCEMKFSFKHVRDNHEKSACHVYTHVSFLVVIRFPQLNMRCNTSKFSSIDKHLLFWLKGNFEETDEQFRSRPRGGRKRKCPTIETLLRKRVLSPNQSDSILDNSSELLSWMLSAEDDEQP